MGTSGPGCATGTAAAAALALALTAGCSAPPTPAPTRDDGLATATYDAVGLERFSTDNAVLTGTVEDLDGCLTVQGTGLNAGWTWVPVFRVDDPVLTSVDVGTAVELEGGGSEGPASDWTIPAACSDKRWFWRVYPG